MLWLVADADARVLLARRFASHTAINLGFSGMKCTLFTLYGVGGRLLGSLYANLLLAVSTAVISQHSEFSLVAVAAVAKLPAPASAPAPD